MAYRGSTLIMNTSSVLDPLFNEGVSKAPRHFERREKSTKLCLKQ